jgi:hypothetical protein
MNTLTTNRTPSRSLLLMKIYFFGFYNAKSLRTILKSIVSNVSFSIEHIAKPFKFSCDIVYLR